MAQNLIIKAVNNNNNKITEVSSYVNKNMITLSSLEEKVKKINNEEKRAENFLTNWNFEDPISQIAGLYPQDFGKKINCITNGYQTLDRWTCTGDKSYIDFENNRLVIAPGEAIYQKVFIYDIYGSSDFYKWTRGDVDLELIPITFSVNYGSSLRTKTIKIADIADSSEEIFDDSNTIGLKIEDGVFLVFTIYNNNKYDNYFSTAKLEFNNIQTLKDEITINEFSYDKNAELLKCQEYCFCVPYLINAIPNNPANVFKPNYLRFPTRMKATPSMFLLNISNNIQLPYDVEGNFMEEDIEKLLQCFSQNNNVSALLSPYGYGGSTFGEEICPSKAIQITFPLIFEVPDEYWTV